MGDLRKAFESRRPLLSALASTVVEVSEEALDGLQHIDRVYGRAKSVDSFIAKAQEKADRYAEPLEDIEDQVGLRVLVFYESDIDTVVSKLRETFLPVEDFRHEPARDEEFGYLTHHLVFAISDHHKPDGWDDLEPIAKTFEAQVRTLFMHAYAEPQHNFGYKRAEDLSSEVRRELAWIAASAWGADRAYGHVLESIRALEEGRAE